MIILKHIWIKIYTSKHLILILLDYIILANRNTQWHIGVFFFFAPAILSWFWYIIHKNSFFFKLYNWYSFSRSDIVMLPDEARGPACRFRWWQPFHSGEGRDLWAIDGISINNHLFNTINLDMANYQNDTRHIVANLGTLSQSYCGSRPSMRLVWTI